ncbi:MAG: hypothetical protein HRU08_01015 [Oleispira sp.]|nr:hypothetical protein [Oleispira sp.]
MKKLLPIITSAGIAATCMQAEAFTQPTHKRIVQDAISYMASHPESTNYDTLVSVAQAAGYSITEFANIVG